MEKKYVRYVEFIGLPGVGKSTTIKILREKINRKIIFRSNKRNALNQLIYANRTFLFLKVTSDLWFERGANLKNALRRARMIVFGPIFAGKKSTMYMSDECSIVYLSAVGAYGQEWIKIVDKIYPKAYKKNALFVFFESDYSERMIRKKIRSQKNISSVAKNKKNDQIEKVTDEVRLKAITFWKKYLIDADYQVISIDNTDLDPYETSLLIHDMISKIECESSQIVLTNNDLVEVLSNSHS